MFYEIRIYDVRSEMLNKEICRECMDKHLESVDTPYAAVWLSRRRFEQEWVKGSFCCVRRLDRGNGRRISIEEIPEWCDYELEQMMVNQDVS